MHIYGWPPGITAKKVKAAFPTVQGVHLKEDDEWYLRKAVLVFSTVEEAKDITVQGATFDGHRLVLKWDGVRFHCVSLRPRDDML